MSIYVNFDGITALFEQARREARNSLFEHEVYELIRLIGGETIPTYVLLAKGERLSSDKLQAIPGDTVVVKVVCPTIVHKSDVGAVRVVPKELDKVLSAVRAMAYEVPEQYARAIERDSELMPVSYRGLRGEELRRAVTRDMRGMLLVQFMPVSHEFGNELIVSLRSTREFGMVISAGLGGTDTQLYTESLKKGRAIVAASVAMTEGEAFLELFRETISYQKLAGQTRGQKRLVTDEQLLECFCALIAVGRYFSAANAEAPFFIDELEVNPFAFANYLMLPLDGLCRFSLPAPESSVPRPIAKIDKLLHPTSIGVIGVSEREMNVGRTIVKNILANGYDADRLCIIHPHATTIDGVAAVPGLEALPGKLDLLILAIRADQAADIVDTVVARDLAEAVILIPGGLGETAGSEERSNRIRQRIHEAHLRADGGPIFVGGNSLGILSPPGHYDSLFIPEAKLPKQRGDYPRRSVFISQSGAFMITRMSRLPCLDPAYALSIGNQIDLTASDIVRFINGRPEIRTIAAYMEGFNDLDGLAFAREVRTAVCQGKEVIVYKAGRTQEGKTATSGHTASIAGDYMACESCLHQAGAMVASTFTEFEALFHLSHALHDKVAAGRRIAAVCNAGFESVGIADNILGEDFTLEMATLGTQTQARLAEILAGAGLASLVDVKNPLDLTPMAGEAVYEAVVATLLRDPDVDGLVVGVTPLAPLLKTLPEEWTDSNAAAGGGTIHARLAPLIAGCDKPVVIVIDGGTRYDPLACALEQEGIAVFRSADQAVAILGKYLDGRIHARQLTAIAPH